MSEAARRPRPSRATAAPRPAKLAKRCTTCGRFRAYEPDDRYCLVCGSDSLESTHPCGRAYDYALAEDGDLHCPRCGEIVRGRSSEFEP